MTPRHLKLVLLATGCLVAVGGCSGQGIGTNQYVAVCGDGLRERTEQCDGADLGGHSCQTIGYSDGTLGCLPDCTFDWSDCYIIDTCGNGVFDQPMEECDGPFLNGATCVDLGYDEGTVACSVSCTYDTSGCSSEEPYCGDGVINGAETCDGSDFGADSCQTRGMYSGALSCDTGCAIIDDSDCGGFCGDGICDFMFGESNTGCSNDCVGYMAAISAGEDHSCAVASDGTAWCWGAGRQGRLGNGSTTDSATPVQVSGLTNAVAIAAGWDYSCAVLSNGTAWCWGRGDYGQLGNGPAADSSTPVQVSSLTNAVTIAVGDGHACAVRSDSTAWCWGHGGNGQLGNDTCEGPWREYPDHYGWDEFIPVKDKNNPPVGHLPGYRLPRRR